MTPLAGIAKRAVSNGKLGKPASRTLRLIGAEHAARKVQALNDAAPAIAEIALPKRFATKTLRLDTDGGRDQIAMRAWTHGWRSFEKPLPAVYAACITEGSVVLDVGANTGFYALLAGCVDRSVHVHAFEPLPAAADQLDLNLELNPGVVAVTVVRAAVDAEAGEIDLLVPPGDSIPTSASLESSFQPVWADTVRVPRTTVDEYASGLGRVDALKVDVEGAEPRVLEGARETLRSRRPVVFFEAINHGDVWRADCPRIDAVREAAGYVSVLLFKDCISVKSAVAWESGCENQALWPAERVGELGELAARLRLAYVD